MSAQTNQNRHEPRGPIEKAFGAQLTHAMGAKRLGARQVSDLTSISPGVIRAYQRGTYLPRPPALAQLEEALQVRFDLVDASVMVPKPMVVPPAPPAPPIVVRLTIAQAKAGLAANYDVDPSHIEIHLRG